MKTTKLNISFNNHQSSVGVFFALAIALVFLGISTAAISAATFSIGDRVAANATVNVRTTPGGSSAGQHFSGDLGTVAAGPTNATFGGVNYVWYKVNWDTAPTTGWSIEGALTKLVKPGVFTLSNQTPVCDQAPPAGPAVTLNWTASANAASYTVKRNGVLISQDITGTTFYNSLNLVAGQTYTYVVTAVNAAGTTDSQTISVAIPANVCTPTPGTFTLSNQTPVCDQTPPAGPAVTLNWTVSANATSYTVKRNGVVIGQGISGTTFYNNLNLVAGQTYNYVVTAVNATGSTDSQTRTVAIPANVCTPAPGAFTLSNQTPVCDQTPPAGPAVTLNWTASANAASYTVKRNGVVIGQGVTGTTFYNNLNLVAGQAYTYVVTAVNATGSTDSQTLTVTIPANVCTPAPGAFTLSNQTPVCDQTPPAGPAITLNWTASANAASYTVKRNGGVISQGITGTTFYNNLNLVAGQTYTYVVTAVNAAGATDSQTLSVTIPANVCTPAPGAFTLSNQTPVCDQTPPAGPAVTLNWTPAANAASYTVKRNGVVIGQGVLGTTFYNNLNLVVNQTYNYLVTAVNATGTTDSQTLAVTIPANVCTPAVQANVVGTDGIGLRLRSNPSITATILAVIPEGETVIVLGDTQANDGYVWWRIQYGGQAGWAVSQFLTTVPTTPPPSPAVPTNLRQLQADGVTFIPNGGNTTSGSVVLTATANGSSAQQFKLQFEVRPWSTSFSSPTHESDYVQGGTEARVTVSSLINQQGYNFRVRELNANGQASAWVTFGGSGPAFVVNNPQLPSALFVWSPTLPFTGQAVQFTAQAAGTAGASFVWNFGDGQTATGTTVSHTFTQAGQLNVKLTASNSQGSQDHTETISVVSQNLQQQINDLSKRTTNLLNQLLVDAHQCATAADYFQEGVDAAPSQIALSAAFDAMSLGKTAADMKDWIKLTLIQDVVVEGHTEVVKWVSGWILNQAVNSHQSYERIFIPNLETFVAQKKSEIEILRQQALAAASSLTQQQADQLAANLRARASGNVALADNYSSKARLPITYADLKSYDESSWSFIAGEHLFGVSVGIGLIAVGDGVHGAPAVLLSVSSTAGLGTLDSVKILAGQDTDSQMLGLSVDVLAQATLAVRDMADNAKNGLQAVRDAQILETPKGQITVQHIAQGRLDSFGFSPRWFTVSARADVTVQNNGTIPTDYYVQAVYPNSFTTVGLLPFHTYGIGERSYDIPVMSVTNGIRLNPGEQTTVQLWFKTQDGGQVPNGLINYTLVAATTNGSYLADAETGQFATTLVDQNSNAVDHATMPDVLLAASPVHSTLIKFGGSSVCSYNIYIVNPLDSSLLLNLQQGLPSGTIVVAADEGTVSGNQMLWELNLPPGASRLIQTTLCLPSDQSGLTNVALAAYDAINTTWLQFQAVPTTVQVQDWPASQLQVTGLTSSGFAMTARHFVPGVFQSQWTTNFINWYPLTTTTNSQGAVQILDAEAASKPSRFYRTVKME